MQLEVVFLVAIIALGYGIKRIGWVSADAFGPLSVIALRITLPCALAVSFDSFDMVPSLWRLTYLGLLASLALMFAGGMTGRKRREAAFGILNVQGFNIGLFAMPFVATFVGPDAIVYAAMFDLGSSVAAAGIGYGWAVVMARPDGRPVPAGVSIVRSPVLIAYVLLAGMRLVGLHLPGPVLAFAQLVGSANTFVAMLMIGVSLELAVPTGVRVLRLLGARYLVVAGLCVVAWFFPMNPDQRLVVLMLAFAPLPAMSVAFTGEAGLDVRASAFLVSVTALVAVVAMPAVPAVLTALLG